MINFSQLLEDLTQIDLAQTRLHAAPATRAGELRYTIREKFELLFESRMQPLGTGGPLIGTAGYSGKVFVLARIPVSKSLKPLQVAAYFVHNSTFGPPFSCRSLLSLSPKVSPWAFICSSTFLVRAARFSWRCLSCWSWTRPNSPLCSSISFLPLSLPF